MALIMKKNPVKRFTAILTALFIVMGIHCFAADGDIYDTHTVAPGETLSTIAKKYSVTLDELAALNKISDINIISVGTVLQIPGTAAKTPDTESSENKLTPPPQTTGAAAKQNAPQPAAGAAARGYSTMLTSFDTKISLSFVDTDIRDALSAFALNMGYNIIYKGESPKITMSMKDVTMGEALDYMMKLYDLTYITNGNTIIVGDKSKITESFSEATKIAEFTTTYVTAETIIAQISTFNIQVNATLSGGNKYRFVAQGLPADLARLRSLIAMVDRRENASGGETSASTFYSVELSNITAAEFQRVLSAAGLPSGVILPSRPNTLYIFALPTEYNTIKSIKDIVDVKSSAPVTAEQETIVEKTLKYVTVDLIEAQLSANADISIIKISTNKTKLWLRGYSVGIGAAEKIIALLDKPENAQLTKAQIFDRFTPIVTQYITADRLRDTLSRLSIEAVMINYPENPKTLYVYASDNDLVGVRNLLSIIDIPANAAATADEMLALFQPVECKFISADQLNDTLKNMSLPTGIIYAQNPNTLYVCATENDLTKIRDLLNIIDIPANADTAIASELKSVTCRYITAEQLNKMLSNMSLPTGLIFNHNPQILYLDVTDKQLEQICEVVAAIDTFENSKAGADSFNIYPINLLFINVDKAVDFVNQMNLGLNIVRMSNSQKQFWVMGAYSGYLVAKNAIAGIDNPGATLVGSFDTFTLENVTAGEAKKLIDNAKITGVLTYVPNGQEKGNRIVVYFPNDARYDIISLINKIDNTQATYRKIIERLQKSIYYKSDLNEDPNDPNTWKLVNDRREMIANLAGIPVEKIKIYSELVMDGVLENDPNKDYDKVFAIVYLDNATIMEIEQVEEVLIQIGKPKAPATTTPPSGGGSGN